MKNKVKGFTLVELLAVIVILAVILVIAVPKITDTIKNSKIASFESSAKTIASQAEKKKMEKEILGNTNPINCSDIANINNDDYASCEINFDASGNAKITLIGKGKFEGLKIVDATKDKMSVTLETDSSWFTYKDVVGGIAITGYTAGMNADITIKDKDACVSYFPEEIAKNYCSDPEQIYYGLINNSIKSSHCEEAKIEVKWLDHYVNGGGRDIIIPSYIDGKKVIAIDDFSFAFKYLTSVVIPNTVKTIGDAAFADNNLVSIEIPNSVTYIGHDAFNYNQLTSIIFPTTPITISDTAFSLNPITNDGTYTYPANIIVESS